MPRTIHRHADLSATEMYDITQTSDEIKDGDLFVCSGGKVVGFLMKAWPTVLFGSDETKELHLMNEHGVKNFDAEYPGLYDSARVLARELGLPSEQVQFVPSK